MRCVFILAAFGDFSCGFGGIEVNDSIVIEGIDAIHAKGGKAKVAYGGALYDMSSFIHNKYVCDAGNAYTDSLQTPCQYLI